jgi:hypothetical protein
VTEDRKILILCGAVVAAFALAWVAIFALAGWLG